MRDVIVLCAVIIALSGWAQTEAPPYRLGVEDVITITVQRHPEFSREALIPPDGLIDLPVGGKARVAGMTVPELARLVTEHLRERLLNPEVVVALKSQRMQRIYVMGGVTHPGVYDTKAGWRVLEALTVAGGVSSEGRLHAVVLVRAQAGTEERRTCNVARFLRAGDMAANPAIQPGDVIYVPTQRRTDWQQILAIASVIGIAANLTK